MSEQDHPPVLGQPTEVRAGATVDPMAGPTAGEPGPDRHKPEAAGPERTPTGSAARFSDDDTQGGTGGLNAGGAG